MELPSLVRPLQSSSAHSTMAGAPRVPGEFKWQLTSVRNSGMALNSLQDVAAGTPTAECPVPKVVSQAEKKAPAELRSEGPSASCEEALKRLMSRKQGRPLKECLMANKRSQG